MKHRVVFLVIGLLVLGTVLAYAQQGVAEINFPFTAGGKAFAAGKYTFDMPDASSVAIRGASGSSIMLIVTTLGRHAATPDFEVVFDKVGDKTLLSEVWFPERDGYLLLTTKEAHQHAIVKGTATKK